MASTKSTTDGFECKAEQDFDQSRPHCFPRQQFGIECPNKMNKDPQTTPAPHTPVGQPPTAKHQAIPIANPKEPDQGPTACGASNNALDAFQVHCSIACRTSNPSVVNPPKSEPDSMLPNLNADILMISGLASVPEGSSNLAQVSALNPPQCAQTITDLGVPPVSCWLPIDSERRDDSTAYDDEGSEDAVSLIRRGLALDRTAESNALPFVLQAYTTWISRIAFDPLKMTRSTQEFVYSQFKGGNQSRWTITLLANIGTRIGSEEFVGGKHNSMLSALQIVTRRQLGAMNSRTNTKKHALAKALASAIEAMIIYFFTSPVSVAISIKYEAAPIFRQLCSEPPDRPIDLPSVLQHPLGCLGHYAYIEILFGVLMDIPTSFRYEAGLSSSRPYRSIPAIQSDGIIQWTRGIPNQLILVFAHMQSIRQDGLTPNRETVGLLEREIRELPPFNGSSSDRFLAIMRSVVQECWRQAAFVYLYMAVCGDPSDTLRVQEAFRRYIRLLNRTKPGRVPDEFLILTLQLIYPAAQRLRDREVIKQRVYSRDRTRVATTFILSVMDDVWGRADAEGRPIIWSDVAASQRAALGR